jgi:glycine hydroxymethyltransferase
VYGLTNTPNTHTLILHTYGPHYTHSSLPSALAVALKQAQTPEFRAYQEAVVANCDAMALAFQSKGM